MVLSMTMRIIDRKDLKPKEVVPGVSESWHILNRYGYGSAGVRILATEEQYNQIKNEIEKRKEKENKELASRVTIKHDSRGFIELDLYGYPSDKDPDAVEILNKLSQFVYEKIDGSVGVPTTKADVTNLNEAEDFVKQYKEPVDYKKMFGQSRVIFISDIHTDISPKEEIINNLEQFKELGITVVALEMFSSKDQKIIDNYFVGKASKEDLKKALKGWEKGPGIIEEYIKIVDKCKDLGIRVIGIDIPYEIYYKHDINETFRIRNIEWVNAINKALNEDANARVLVFGGGAHFGRSPDTANKIAEGYGIPYTVIRFIGIEKANNKTYYSPDLERLIPIAAAHLGVGNEKFELPSWETKDPKKANHFFVHLPQVEEDIF